MKKRFLVPVIMVLAIGLMTAFASPALATPGQTARCSSCHGLLGTVTIAATPISFTDTSTTYQIAVNNPLGINGWAVFNGTTKVAGSSGNGTDVVLPNGITYSVFGVSGDGSAMTLPHAGYATISISPKAPDHTAPTTTSAAVATYAGTATIHLTGHDNVGGSGVASTSYILDGATETVGTTVSTSVLGTHTLEFWSVDASNNVENPHNTVGFIVNAAPPAPKVYSYTYKFKTKNKAYKGLKAVLKRLTTGKTYTLTIPKNGKVTFKNLPGGKYKLSTKGNSKFKFKATTIKVGP